MVNKHKRRVLAHIGVGATTVWAKPIVDSVILPAHAQSTLTSTTRPPVEESTPQPVEESTPQPVEESTPQPVEESTPQPVRVQRRIVVSTTFDGIIENNHVGIVVPGTGRNAGFLYSIKLSTMPTGPVTVFCDCTPDAPYRFDTVYWNQPSWLNIFRGSKIASMDDEIESKFTFTAEGGGYDGVTAELTYTIGFFGPAKPQILEVTKVSESSVRITWSKPRTRAEIIGYRILELKGDRYLTLPYPVFYRPSERSSLPTGLSDITTWFIVQAEIKFRNDEVVTVNSEPSNVIETL